MPKRIYIYLTLLAILLILPGITYAQAYSFELPEQSVNVYWNEDGTTSIDYIFVFKNDPGGHPIEYVDVGIPNSNFDESSITAEVNGSPVSYISRDEFEGEGSSGVAIALGSQVIPPGETGTVRVFIDIVRDTLYPDDDDSDYVSAVFSPAYFLPAHGTTDQTTVFHLPPGVQPEEPRWHTAPSGWSSQPLAGFDTEGRITYTWTNANADMSRRHDFGASFPKVYIPSSAIVTPSISGTLGSIIGSVMSCIIPCGIGFFVIAIIVLSFRSAQRRKLQYLPPKIAIEGHGIKRGLNAIEAAILLEQPLDKILTMMLFSVIKKDAAKVISSDPLKIEKLDPIPDNLQIYEIQFIDAMSFEKKREQRKALQDMMISLVRSVSKKMKGFSRKETVAYYRAIVARAWDQVEAAETPEVKSQKFEEVMDWTMLDGDYEGRTRRTFHGGPVFVPIWWHRYDPTFSRGATSARPSTVPSTSRGGGGVSLPTLPGGTFAASVVHGVQNFSSSVIGSVTDFTSGVTNKTNPVPKTSSSSWSGGGGSGCACACACAGCACACAGGGR